jgi:hypothetical protein
VNAAVWLSLAWLCAMSAYGQSGANFGHSDRGMFSVPRLGAPDLPPAAPPRAPHRPASLPYFPLFPGGWDYGYAAPYTPPPAVTIVQAPPPYIPAPPPPLPHAEIHEYKVAPESATAAEPPSFAIALKDGSVRSAMAVTTQGDTLHYVDPEGRHERVSLDAVDRETTTRLNRARNLPLRLPPPAR